MFLNKRFLLSTGFGLIAAIAAGMVIFIHWFTTARVDNLTRGYLLFITRALNIQVTSAKAGPLLLLPLIIPVFVITAAMANSAIATLGQICGHDKGKKN